MVPAEETEPRAKERERAAETAWNTAGCGERGLQGGISGAHWALCHGPTGSCVSCCSTSNTCMGSEWRCEGPTTSLPHSPTSWSPTTRAPSTCLVRPHCRAQVPAVPLLSTPPDVLDSCELLPLTAPQGRSALISRVPIPLLSLLSLGAPSTQCRPFISSSH